MKYNLLMIDKKLLDKIAPCGLSCEKCFAFIDSEIKKHSQALRENLGNFEPYSCRFSELFNEPVFNLYPYFKTHLDYFADAQCGGCRKNTCKLFEGCHVRECTKAKKVDFCFQCKEFPCNNTGFDDNMKQRWILINSTMKKMGVEAYYLQTKNELRYQ